MGNDIDQDLHKRIQESRLSGEDIAMALIEGFGDEDIALQKSVDTQSAAKKLRATILGLGYDVLMIPDSISKVWNVRAIVPEYEHKVIDVLQGLGWNMIGEN